MEIDTFFGRINEPGLKLCCQVSRAMGVLIEIAGYKDWGKAAQEAPNMIKLIGRGLTRPRVSLISQWVYDPLSRRIKLRLLIQALLFLMKVGSLLFKFSQPLSMFHITLKIMLCVVATAQVLMASNKLKSGIASPDGLGKLLLALIFPLLASIIPYFYGTWSTGMASWCMITFFSVYTVFLQDLLEKEGFKDVLLATISIHALIDSNSLQEKIPEVTQNLWNISQNITNGCIAVKTLALFLGRVLTIYR
ncbi:MAG: hypothetical protein LBS22_02805 [Puniceicoccales bacterium]|jgi:hypothetical protein|nr:hypothetical protein [Puniceicoccales bacterium]